MQSEFSPSLTRLDAVLWLFRIQMWLSVIGLLQGFIVPYSLVMAPQNLSSFGIPILVLALFPRVLASAILGRSERASLSSMYDFKPLIGRCVGAVLFVGVLGRAVLAALAIAEALISGRGFGLGSASTSAFIWAQIVSTTITFFVGFALAFGPAIRGNFRSR